MPQDAASLAGSRRHSRLTRARVGLLAVASGAWRFGRREPLVHFAILGGLVFGLNAWLHPPSAGDRVITVTAALQRQIMDQWDEDHDRHPGPGQVRQMVDLWIASEILYREGKAMGLDRGDEMIRTRIAHKLQLLIFSDVSVGEPSEAEIRTWFEDNRSRYDVPDQVSFYLAPAQSAAEAQQFVARIEAGTEPQSLQETARAFIDRPAGSIAAAFGQGFVEQLRALPRGQWSAIQSKEGWHVARLDGVTEGVAVPIESVLSQAIEQWKIEQTRRKAVEAVARLRAGYTIRYEPVQ